MKSEWKVERNYIAGKPMYAVYRLKGINGMDHSGNREYAGEYIEDKRASETVAKVLNDRELIVGAEMP